VLGLLWENQTDVVPALIELHLGQGKTINKLILKECYMKNTKQCGESGSDLWSGKAFEKSDIGTLVLT
jgi:hypothetical protein